jgi:hypothetical protein
MAATVSTFADGSLKVQGNARTLLGPQHAPFMRLCQHALRIGESSFRKTETLAMPPYSGPISRSALR